MRHVSITRCGFVLLASVLVSYVQCDAYNSLYAFSTNNKFLLLIPLHKRNDDYVFNLDALSPESHLYSICPGLDNVLEFREIKKEAVSPADHKCHGSPVKTSAILYEETKIVYFEDVISQISTRRIGYKVRSTVQKFDVVAKSEADLSDVMDEVDDKTFNPPEDTVSYTGFHSSRKRRNDSENEEKIRKKSNQASGEMSSMVSEGSNDTTMSRKFKFIPVITVVTDTLTATTKMVYYPVFFNFGMSIPVNPEVEKIPFNMNEDAYEGHNFDLDALYAESYNENPEQHLVKQQLAAADDFLLDTWKDLTYHNLNTAPMWNIYTNQWRAIEDRIRQVLRVLVGAYIGVGTAMSPNHSDDEKKYMKDKLVLIPDIFWKIVAVVHTITRNVSGIIIIMHGNLDVYRKPICQDTCQQNNWMGISNSDHKSGLTYCCDLNRKNMRKLNIQLSREFDVDAEYNPLNLGAVTKVVNLLPLIEPAQQLHQNVREGEGHGSSGEKSTENEESHEGMAK